MQERIKAVAELLASEHFEVERIPRDVMVKFAPALRTEGEVTVIQIVEEVLTVVKQLRLKEEVKDQKKRLIWEYREQVVLLSKISPWNDPASVNLNRVRTAFIYRNRSSKRQHVTYSSWII